MKKILAAGHLRPGYTTHGLFDNNRVPYQENDYFANPAHTIRTLAEALPFLPADLQEQTKKYMHREFERYPPYRIWHTGWAEGAFRQIADVPAPLLPLLAKTRPQEAKRSGLPPQNLYAVYRYAQVFGDAANLLEASSARIGNPTFSADLPYHLNGQIAGRIGRLRLAQMAGVKNAATEMQEKELIELLMLRLALTKNAASLSASGFEFGGYSWTATAYDPETQRIAFNIPGFAMRSESNPLPMMGYFFTIDYLEMVPELAAILRHYAAKEVADYAATYSAMAPYWFVSLAEEAGNEGVLQPLHDVIGLFNAKAMILREPRRAVEKYLDVPAFRVGDLFYIQKLCALLAAG